MAEMLSYGDKGPRVKELQRLLNRNAYRHPRRLLEVDGEFGPLTAGAVQGTKFWMGYAREDVEPVAGDFFMSVIKDKEPLPGEYAKRRKARLANVAGKDKADRLRRRALAIIKDELGTMEKPPHSNSIKYNAWWGWGNVPYCVIGISWAWVKAGSESFKRGSRWANTDVMLADAKAGRNGLHLTHDPDPGCPGVVDLNGDANPDHAITFVKDNGNGTCTTYEFNVRSGWMEGVMRKTRPLRSCWWVEVEA